MKQIISKKDFALFRELVRTDFKLRYQGSFLGYLWSLLKPLMLFGILYLVFTKFLHIGKGIPNYAISLLLGIVLWTFFVEATSNSLKSIVGRGGLIRKINIPRYLIPLSTAASAFINMLLNLVVVFIFVSFAENTPLSWQTAVIFPFLVLELSILATGIGFLLAAAYVKFRDVDHIWDIVRQALFYTVPIIYPLSRIPSESIQKFILMNPLSQIIQDSRVLITYGETTTINDVFGSRVYELIPYTIVVLTFIIGYSYFQKRSKSFAENV